jgi:hypothetical protein
MELAIEKNSKKTDKTDEQLVLAEYYKYLDIFSKEKAHRFPESRPWDHKIKMEEGFEPKLFKTTTSHRQNKLNWTNSLKKTSKEGTLGHPNHQWLPRFFLFPKRTANFDHVRTTGI